MHPGPAGSDGPSLMGAATPFLPPTRVWEYRTGFGAPVLVRRTAQQGARPRLGEIVAAGGARWRVYDRIVGRTQLTLLVERLHR